MMQKLIKTKENSEINPIAIEQKNEIFKLNIRFNSRPNDIQPQIRHFDEEEIPDGISD